MFQHPAAPKVNDEHWQTTCWNAAWFAALCAGNSLPLEHVDLDGATLAVETTVRSLN
jgi:hypothetical protein